MSEEAKEEVPSKEELLAEPSKETQEEPAPDLTEVEQKAVDMGWSQEGVEGKRNLSAEEFVDRQVLYNDLHSLKRKNKRLQDDVDNISKYQDKVRSDERKKVIEELKAKKVAALEDEDHKRVVDIDEQLAEARIEESKVETPAGNNADFKEWVDSNQWYSDNGDMRMDADVYGETYLQRNPEKSRDEVYAAVTKYIKRTHPDKFGNVNRDKPAAVASAGAPAGSKGKKGSKLTTKGMPSADIGIMKTVLRTSKMTEQAYLKEYYEMS